MTRTELIRKILVLKKDLNHEIHGGTQSFIDACCDCSTDELKQEIVNLESEKRNAKQSPVIADTPESIALLRLLTIKNALKLESLGMVSRQGSVATAAREILAKTGRRAPRSKVDLYQAILLYVDDIKAGRAAVPTL